MSHGNWNMVTTLLLGCGLLTQFHEVSAAASQPNFVFILIDDLGARDVGAFHPETFYETPHLNALAASGMKFTQAYAANPVCSPTRFSILTGRYPTRAAATNWFSGKRAGRFLPAEFNDFMPLEEVTLAESLRGAGYRTAFVGKWHLGATPEFGPLQQGFEFNIAGYDRGSPNSYFSPYRNPYLSDGPPGEFLTERLTDEAIQLMKQLRDGPFLLYLSHYTVHTPLQAPKDLVRKYELKAQSLPAAAEFAPEEQVWPVDEARRTRVVQKHAVYAAMVETMDASVGRVLAALDDLQLADNTVVVFFSDNGGLSTSEGAPTSNEPFRAGKGWLYEGGIREPLLIRWPGVTPRGSECHTPVISVDFPPTLLDIAGVASPTTQPVDGVSLVPLLKGEPLRDRDLFWHYPHYGNQGGFPGGAIRRGSEKLIERFEDGRVHLFDVANDVSERHDLAMERPERVQELRSALHRWYREVDARFLESAPGGPPAWRPAGDE